MMYVFTNDNASAWVRAGTGGSGCTGETGGGGAGGDAGGGDADGGAAGGEGGAASGVTTNE